MQTILKKKSNVFNETNCKIIQKDWQCTLQKSSLCCPDWDEVTPSKNPTYSWFGKNQENI